MQPQQRTSCRVSRDSKPQEETDVYSKQVKALEDEFLDKMNELSKNHNRDIQNASEMINDLNMALKRPEGGFVDQLTEENDGLTKRIPTIDAGIKTNNTRTAPKEDEKTGFFQEHKKIIVSGIIIVSFIAVFIITLLITLGIANSSSPKDVQIPNVVGLTREEAKSAIENSKLVFNTDVKEIYSADVPEGCVISQDPQYINNYSIK